MEQPTLTSLRALFAEDAAHVADGGGVASATLRPPHGAERLARLYLQIARNTHSLPQRHVLATLNGETVLLIFTGEALATAMWIEVRDERIATVHALRHPGKLARLAASVTNPAAHASLH